MYVSAPQLAKMLRNGNFRLGHEKLLQEDVEKLLKANSIVGWREYRLGAGERVDFLLDGGIALELKIKCSPRMVLRQLERYATYEQVAAIILVTLNATSMPDWMNGKPVYVVNLGAGYL